MVWSHLKILLHSKSAGDSGRGKKERKTEADTTITSRNGQEWSLEIP